jgi:hypothetical protein
MWARLQGRSGRRRFPFVISTPDMSTDPFSVRVRAGCDRDAAALPAPERFRARASRRCAGSCGSRCVHLAPPHGAAASRGRDMRQSAAASPTSSSARCFRATTATLRCTREPWAEPSCSGDSGARRLLRWRQGYQGAERWPARGRGRFRHSLCRLVVGHRRTSPSAPADQRRDSLARMGKLVSLSDRPARRERPGLLIGRSAQHVLRALHSHATGDGPRAVVSAFACLPACLHRCCSSLARCAGKPTEPDVEALARICDAASEKRTRGLRAPAVAGALRAHACAAARGGRPEYESEVLFGCAGLLLACCMIDKARASAYAHRAC